MRRTVSALAFAAAIGASVLTGGPASAQVWTPARPVAFAAQAPQGGVLVLPLASADELARRGGALDAASRAAVGRALTSARFSYGVGQTLSLRGVGAHDLILVIGVPAANGPAADFQRAGMTLGRSLSGERGAVSVAAEGLSPEAISQLAVGLGYGGYSFDRHRSAAAGRDAPGAVTFVSANATAARNAWSGRGAALTEGLTFARDLSNEPANIIYPESFVERTQAAFAGIPNVTIEVLDVAAMQQLGMGAILGVGQGSERPPRMMIIRYRAPGSPAQPLVLVGKGITFDSGGISIKPSANMGNMKMDMSGAASVTGAVLALSRSRAPTHVVAIAALAENMPDGGAMRPGDILRAMNGRTIEVISTDAEGRLVLADAIAYAEARLDPALIIDVATLTGAVGGALGPDYAGLFANNEALATQLVAAGEATGEILWRLPIHPSYATTTASQVADIVNSGVGPGAGTGAYFIASFLEPGTPWAHLDIAAVAWRSGASSSSAPGSSGYAVRLLEQFVRDYRPVQ